MRHPVFKHFGLKIISLGLAVLIWLVIKMSLERPGTSPPGLLRGPATQEYHCPVLVLHSATNAQIFQVQPPEVTVRLSGDPVVLRRLRADDIQAYVKVLDLAQAQGRFFVDAHLPRDVRLEDIQPSQVSVSPANAK